MPAPGSHAVVVGASMAGLLAARALHGPYARVTVLDRDALPDDATPRRGVPQGRQLHILLARGAVIIDAMFPGLLDELDKAGVPVLRHFREVHMTLGGRTFAQPDKPGDPPTYNVTRPRLEAQVRSRLAELPGVEIVPGSEVTALLHTTAKDRVSGVRVRRAVDATEHDLTADLVVDATGRSGRTTVWLGDLGYQPAPEEKLPVDLMYASRFVRPAPGAMGPLRALLVSPRPGHPRALGALEVEGGRWMVTPAGYTGHHPPTDGPGWEAYVRSVAPAHIADGLLSGERLTQAVTHRFPANRRRRYEKVSRFPAGFLVVGDAACSFNPLYGQGMTVAAMEAEALRACFVRGKGADARDFATGADLSLPEVRGRRTPKVRAGVAYTEQLQAAASVDPVVTETFLRVLGFLDPPTALLGPSFARRVLRSAKQANEADGASASARGLADGPSAPA
jgi:2-polyprenyl-6-methoxyphenol hydroxylase-like FAD-dependent oxidoreductase